VNGPRNVAVGDLVLEKESRLEEPKWIGVVYDIKYDKYGTGTAFIAWTPKDPPNYQKSYGYGCTNIHNIRSQYDVIKK
jgi:hypothetical protein